MLYIQYRNGKSFKKILSFINEEVYHNESKIIIYIHFALLQSLTTFQVKYLLDILSIKLLRTNVPHLPDDAFHGLQKVNIKYILEAKSYCTCTKHKM